MSGGNFVLWSPLIKGTPSSALTVGNTRFDGSTNNATALTDFAIPVGTKFYAEILTVIQNGIYAIFGIAPPTTNLTSYTRTQTNIYGMEFRTQSSSNWTVNSVANGTLDPTNPDSGPNVGQTAERVIGIAVNRVDNELKLYLDNTLKFTLSIPSTGEYHFFATHTGATGYTQTHHNFNGGHDSTGGGDFTAGSATDENGFGEFQYSPPSGHLACCSANLPTSSDIDPAGDDGADDNPTKQFGILTYTGNSTTGQSLTGLGFKPDLIWAKMRSSSQDNQLFDSSRMNTRGTPTPFMLRSNATDAEIDDQAQGNNNPMIASFDTDGFTLGTSGSGPNDNNRTYVAWCWRANGGTIVTNNDGTMTSNVQANTKAGFSIVTYTGDGSDGTVGHGLSKAPEYVISKRRDGTGSWYTYHVGAGVGYVELNSNITFQAGSVPFGSSAPTASVVGATSANRVSGQNFIYYCWHSVEGFSKFGSYEGNSNNNGSFIYLGFRAKYFFLKEIDVNDDWVAYDTARSTFNPVQKVLRYDSTGAEFDGSSRAVDVTSNGLKIRTSNNTINASTTYIYGAWGDASAKYNNTF